MNQLEAQKHVKDLMETFKIAFPLAFSATKEESAENLRNGVAKMLRGCIEENDATAAAIVGIWFASRAPKHVLLAFLCFLEDDSESEPVSEEWPEEIG